MYQATQMVKNHPDERMKEMIGDQKTIISTILVLINNYKKIGFFKDMGEEFQELKELYQEVEITTQVSDPKPVEEDGVLTFESTESSTIIISEETLKKIIDKVAEMRENVISI